MWNEFIESLRDPESRRKCIEDFLAVFVCGLVFVGLTYALAFAKMWGWY